MNDTDATDVLAAVSQPALKHLAATIDREFQRRDPTTTTHYEYAASHLGVDPTGLVVLSEGVDPPLGHSVGRWLYDAQARWSAEHVGAFVDRPAASETVPGATGDRGPSTPRPSSFPRA